MTASTLPSLAVVVAAAGFVLRNLAVAGALGVTGLVAGRSILEPLRQLAGRRPGGGGNGGSRRRPGGGGGGAGNGDDSPGGGGGSRWPGLWLRLDGGLETAAVAATLGLAAVAHAGLLLGTAGWLRPWPVLGTLLMINLASRPGWRWLVGCLGQGTVRLRLRLAERSAGRPCVAGTAPTGATVASLLPAPALPALIAAVAVGPVVALALYPPVAFDATLYHLPYARAFAATGALPFLPDLRFPIFPQLQEVLFALGMTLAGDVTAQLMALLETVLTGAILLCWGRQFSRAASWIGAAVYAGCPIVVYLAATAYVEAGLVLFFTAALFAVSRWRAGGGEGWLPLAAVFAAAAADSKYLGLLALGLVVLAAAAGRPEGEDGELGGGRRWRRVLAAGAAGALVLAPWTWRIVAATGNPVFPYLAQIFGRSPWSRPSWVVPEVHSVAGLARFAGEVVWRLLRAPWDTVLARARTGGYPPYSPLLLLGLPAVLAAAVADRRARGLVLSAAAYGLAAFTILPDARYLLPAVPLLCVALGAGVARGLAAWPVRGGLLAEAPWHDEPAQEAGRTWDAPAPAADVLPNAPWREHPAQGAAAPAAAAARRPGGAARRTAVAAALAVACALPGWLYAGYRLVRSGPLPLTPPARDAFLARTLPLYPAVRHLNQACGSAYSLYGLHAENMAYLAAGRFLGDWSGPAAYRRVVPQDGDLEVFHRHLRALGADHLLMAAGDPYLPAVAADAAAGGRFQPIYADARARLFALAGAGCLGAEARPAAR
jgi:hypothetical protein